MILHTAVTTTYLKKQVKTGYSRWVQATTEGTVVTYREGESLVTEAQTGTTTALPRDEGVTTITDEMILRWINMLKKLSREVTALKQTVRPKEQ